MGQLVIGGAGPEAVHARDLAAPQRLEQHLARARWGDRRPPRSRSGRCAGTRRPRRPRAAPEQRPHAAAALFELRPGRIERNLEQPRELPVLPPRAVPGTVGQQHHLSAPRVRPAQPPAACRASARAAPRRSLPRGGTQRQVEVADPPRGQRVGRRPTACASCPRAPASHRRRRAPRRSRRRAGARHPGWPSRSGSSMGASISHAGTTPASTMRCSPYRSARYAVERPGALLQARLQQLPTPRVRSRGEPRRSGTRSFCVPSPNSTALALRIGLDRGASAARSRAEQRLDQPAPVRARRPVGLEGLVDRPRSAVSRRRGDPAAPVHPCRKLPRCRRVFVSPHGPIQVRLAPPCGRSTWTAMSKPERRITDRRPRRNHGPRRRTCSRHDAPHLPGRLVLAARDPERTHARRLERPLRAARRHSSRRRRSRRSRRRSPRGSRASRASASGSRSRRCGWRSPPGSTTTASRSPAM